MARQLVELGYRGSGEPLKRDEFESRKKAAESFRLSKRMTANVLASHGKQLGEFPFLLALAEREEANRSGKLTVNLQLKLVNYIYKNFKCETARSFCLHRLCASTKN